MANSIRPYGASLKIVPRICSGRAYPGGSPAGFAGEIGSNSARASCEWRSRLPTLSRMPRKDPLMAMASLSPDFIPSRHRGTTENSIRLMRIATREWANRRGSGRESNGFSNSTEPAVGRVDREMCSGYRLPLASKFAAIRGLTT
jgi:hypothetical protein